MENSDMTQIASTTKTFTLFMTAILLMAFVSGCEKTDSDKATAPAAEPPTDVEEIDLSSVPDLFEEPIQPNPLAMAPEDVVITVDGKEITHGEIMQAVQMRMMQLSRQVPPQQLSQMYGEVYQTMTETLIANLLLSNAAATSSLAISDEDLTAEIDRIQTEAPEGQSLEEALAENDVDFSEWKENLRTQMLVGKLVEEKTANTDEATLAEVTEFYQENLDSFKTPETVSASHILLSFTEEDTDETKAAKKEELLKIRDEIIAGAIFTEMAAEHSACPSSENGGSLGTFGRGQMVPAFEAVAFDAEIDVVSEIVETQFGYHLIVVTDKQSEGVRSLNEVKDQLQGYLTGQKKQEALVTYIDELKEAADIITHKTNLDAGVE